MAREARRVRSYDKAIAACMLANRIDTQSIDVHVCLADVYGTMGNVDGAISEYSIVLELDPSHSDARNERAKLYRKKGLLNNVLWDLTRSGFTPNAEIAQLLLDLDRPDEALLHANYLLATYVWDANLFRSLDTIYLFRVSIFSKLGLSKEALSDISMALVVNPKYEDALKMYNDSPPTLKRRSLLRPPTLYHHLNLV